MGDILKFFGMGLLLISAFVFSSEYEKRIKIKNELSAGFLSLLLHIRRKIDCYLTPASELIDDFTDDALLKCGYLESAMREGISEAFLSKKDSLPLYQSVKNELSEFFSDFGRNYKEGTIRELDSLISSLKEKIKKEKEEGEKDIKVARILAVSAALGTVILII